METQGLTPPPPKKISQPTSLKSKLTLAALGTFGVSVFIHVCLLVLVGGVVIIQGVIPKSSFEAVLPTEAATEPSETVVEQPSSDAADAPVDSATVDLTTPVVPDAASMLAPLTTEVVSSVQNFSLPALNSSATAISVGAEGTQAVATGGTGKPNGLRNMGNPFGSAGASSDGLVGYLYDLKQSPDKKPSLQAYDANVFARVVDEFIKRKWDSKVLEPYYKVKSPMTAYQFCIPQMSANEAPKAFEVQRDVEPKGILVHYKGEITAPRSGVYRFVGNGDDILFVRFNNREVLNTSAPYTEASPLSADLKGKVPLAAGAWFQITEGMTYPMEVLIGERPGGLFHAFLMIEQKDVKYPIDPTTDLPILPLFQTAPTRIPKYPLFPAAIRNPKVADEAFVCKEK